MRLHLQEVAAFLLLRGPYAYWGWGVWGLGWPDGTPLPSQLKQNYGVATSACAETSAGTGVFTRTYEHAIVTLDCNKWVGTVMDQRHHKPKKNKSKQTDKKTNQTPKKTQIAPTQNKKKQARHKYGHTKQKALCI
jgi:hypothetical protein